MSKKKRYPKNDDIIKPDLKQTKVKNAFKENNVIAEGDIEEMDDINKDINRDNIYIYTEEGKKYLYVFQKISKEKDFYELRCKDRNCNGRAKININNNIMIITQKCSLDDYESHNYIQDEIIRKKIKNKEATLEEMKDPKFQKHYFIESYLQYPTLNYNEILINLIHQYELTKISYSKAQFSKFKSELNKRYIYNRTINERLNDIKLYSKNLLLCHMYYNDIQTNKFKTFRIFGTYKSISLLNDNNINQFFIDTTYKSVPNDLEDAKCLLVILGYNYTKDLFELILVALLSHEDTNILIEFYQFIISTYKWKPKILTFDFAKANINALKEVFKNNDDVKLIPCFFHLLQSWWRKASSFGLRKKRYIKETKLMLFNLELIPFMNFEAAKKFYSSLKENIPKSENYDKFLDYFENTWLSLNDNENDSIYEFNLWNYSSKIKFKGNKTSLFKQGEMEKYIFFSNNAVESFNHLLNQCLDNNTKVSISKFEEMLKFIFIRFTSNNESENVNKYIEKCLVTTLLRELIEEGYGKNGKLIKSSDYKKLKTEFKEDLVFELTFNNQDNLNDSDEDN